MSGVDVWGYAGNLAYTRYFTHKGVVDAVLYRTNLDYLKGYTVTGVTHGHDGHLQPREWVLGLSGIDAGMSPAVSSLNANPCKQTKIRAVWTVSPQGAGPESREAG